MPSKPPSLADRPLIRAARAALRELADPEKASIIQAYMKSSMPCLGVQTPLHRAACREVFAAHPLASPVAWHDTVLALWREAEYRWRRRLDCGVLRRRPAWISRASMIGSRRSTWDVRHEETLVKDCITVVEPS